MQRPSTFSVLSRVESTSERLAHVAAHLSRSQDEFNRLADAGVPPSRMRKQLDNLMEAEGEFKTVSRKLAQERAALPFLCQSFHNLS